MTGDRELCDKYQEYEAAAEQIRQQNAELLNGFTGWLGRQDISAARIRQHVVNADLYINEFLLYYEAEEAADGTSFVGSFFGYWYIRKVSSTESLLRNQAASLKKFYQFMLEQGFVLPEAVNFLNRTIASEMPRWLATLRRYYDEDITDPDDIWGRGKY